MAKKTAKQTPIRKILVANRGEIALRVLRTCREMGIPCAVAYSEADAESLAVRHADEAVLLGPAGPSESYLNHDRIIAAAKAVQADAIHPGYGFLSENWQFAARCEKEGINFIGPSSASIKMMGDKLEARNAMEAAGVPLIPGTKDAVESLDELKKAAKKIGYPVMIKAVGGGGGKGIKIVKNPDELVEAFERASGEARTAFGNAAVYLEKYFDRARHIEIQVFGDKHGKGIHLGERECSLQRRHQKLVEESPSPFVDEALRKRMGETAVNAVESLGYYSSGTFEFLVDDTQNFYFLEMNTRLQVEHTVTEMRTGMDLVREQIRIARGEAIGYSSEDVVYQGWAIEARINAEDPQGGFLPSIGVIDTIVTPGGANIRFDSLLYPGVEISSHYDSMIGKLVAWGEDRDTAISRLRQALRELRVSGVRTSIPAHLRIMDDPNFQSGAFHTNYLESAIDGYFAKTPKEITEAAIVAALAFTHSSLQAQTKSVAVSSNRSSDSPWLLAGRSAQLRRQGS